MDTNCLNPGEGQGGTEDALGLSTWVVVVTFMEVSFYLGFIPGTLPDMQLAFNANLFHVCEIVGC